MAGINRNVLIISQSLAFSWLSQCQPVGRADLSWMSGEVTVVCVREVSQFVFGAEGRWASALRSEAHPSRWLLTGPDKHLTLGKNNTVSHWDLIITRAHCHTGPDVWPQIAISHPLSWCTHRHTHTHKHLHLTRGLNKHTHMLCEMAYPLYYRVGKSICS